MKDKDLENTTYRFQLESGELVEAQGNEEIEYDGGNAHCRQPVRCPEGRVLRKVLTVEYDREIYRFGHTFEERP